MRSLLVVSFLGFSRKDRACVLISSDPNLWYIGGGVQMARFFSRFLALQIQADVMGKPLQNWSK